MLGVVMAILLLVPIAYIGNGYYLYRVSLKAQEREYASAELRCGAKPVVTAEFRGLLGARFLQLYTPLNPAYDEAKVAVRSPVSLYGFRTDQYFCSAVEALAMSHEAQQLSDSDKNYASKADRKMTQIDAALRAGRQFYSPAVIPPDMSVEERKIFDMRNATIRFSVVERPKTDANGNDKEIELYCKPIDMYTATDAERLNSGEFTVVGHVSTGEIIYQKSFSMGDTNPTYGKFWEVNLNGATCDLSDYGRQLTDAAGLAILTALHEVSREELHTWEWQ